jgi:hypothetical protein
MGGEVHDEVDVRYSTPLMPPGTPIMAGEILKKRWERIDPTGSTV